MNLTNYINTKNYHKTDENEMKICSVVWLLDTKEPNDTFDTIGCKQKKSKEKIKMNPEDQGFSKKIKYLIADTTAFIQNASLQEVATKIITCEEVVNEITNKRQLRRLVVLPYDLTTREVFPENVKIVTDFAKKTGDYPSLSATDIKVIALTYQLEKENVGTEHIRTEPLIQRSVNIITKKPVTELRADTVGFYVPKNEGDNIDIELEDDCKDDVDEKILTDKNETTIEEKINHKANDIKSLSKKFETLKCDALEFEAENVDVLVKLTSNSEEECSEDKKDNNDHDDDNVGWITPGNIQKAKKQMGFKYAEDKEVSVACMTTDFAMQNVLKQMNLNVAALDGRVIKQLRTFILRCYTCFKTTSEMTRIFCPKCGNKTLKRVGVSVDQNGKQVIHINARKPLTGRGKKFSLPRIKGGKHSNNPHLVEDQPFPDQRPSRLARRKNNPLDDDYIAGFSPFVMRDINSKSAQLKIRPNREVKYFMQINPNEAVRRKK